MDNNTTDTSTTVLIILACGITGGSILVILCLTFIVVCSVLICKKARRMHSITGVKGNSLDIGMESHDQPSLRAVLYNHEKEIDNKQKEDEDSMNCGDESFHDDATDNGKVIMQYKQKFIGLHWLSCHEFVMMEQLGVGTFGPVFKAEACGLGAIGRSKVVIAKLISESADDKMSEEFEHEIERLFDLNHKNVAGLLAVCTDKKPHCFLVDAGKHRDLLTYIHLKKKHSFGLRRINSQKLHTSDDILELLHISDDICLGMGYMAYKGLVHGDLSLRNCILGFDGVTKVAQLGLAHQWYPDAYYERNGNLWPIRWMDSETLQTEYFTKYNDIWSFGVVLWELFTLGSFPFHDKSDDEVLQYVIEEHGTLDKPHVCDENLFQVMRSCWEEPAFRPIFNDLHYQIQDIIVDIQVE